MNHPYYHYYYYYHHYYYPLESSRDDVAEQCVGPVLHAMRVCYDASDVLIEGLKALHNFVYLSGTGR